MIRVLYVGSDPESASSAAAALERENERFDVDAATGADEGLDRLAGGDFDCLVTEAPLPARDEIEFLETAGEHDSDLFRILSTRREAIAREVATREAVADGVDDYVLRGSGGEGYELLASRIEDAVARRRAERRAERLERGLALRRELDGVLDRAGTSAAIQRAVVEVLADADPYRAAWFGEYDAERNQVLPRAVAGIDEDAVSPVPVGDETDGGAVLDAVRSGTPAVERLDDSPFDAGADGVPADDCEEVVVVPVDEREGGDGVIVLYLARPGVHDATERRLLDCLAGDVERALAAAEARRQLRRYRTAVEAVPEGVFVLDEDANIVLVNESAAALFGRTADGAEGKPFASFVEAGLVDEDVVDWYLESVREMLSSSSDRDAARYETELRQPDGGIRTVEVHLTLRPYDEEYRGTVGAIRDVTDRVERERELRRQASLLDTLFEQVPVNLYVKDERARHVRTSTPYLREDYPDDEEYFRGKTDLDVFPEALAEETYRDDLEVIETGEPILEKVEYDPSDDQWLLTSKVPWRDDDGAIRGLIGTSQYITDRKERERELERKNERLEEFASIVSHDLQTPLAVAHGHLKQAQRECDSDHLLKVERAHDRMEALIDDLLAYARVGQRAVEAEPLDLAQLANRCWQAIERTGSDATLVTATDRTIRADRNYLLQLLENLLSNAREHGGEDVTVTVGDLDDGFYVADDGPGIPAADREEVFDRGYSSSETGTGFGLSIVREVVEAHGWEIDVAESDGGGARFEVTGVEFDDDR